MNLHKLADTFARIREYEIQDKEIHCKHLKKQLFPALKKTC